MPRIHDVLDKQYVTVLDIATHVHDQSYGSAGNIAIVVTRYSDKFDGARDRQTA